MTLRAILLAVLVAIFVSVSGIWLFRIDNALPGSTVTIEVATEKADAIYIGEVVGMANIFASSRLGMLSFEYVAKVLRNFRGTIHSEYVKVIIEGVPEKDDGIPAGKSKNTFIFFTQKAQGNNLVTKLIPASDENIALVLRILGAK